MYSKNQQNFIHLRVHQISTKFRFLLFTYRYLIFDLYMIIQILDYVTNYSSINLTLFLIYFKDFLFHDYLIFYFRITNFIIKKFFIFLH